MKQFIFVVFMMIICALNGTTSAMMYPLNSLEKAEIELMLDELGLNSEDLCFERDWDLSTKFKSTHQLRMLNDPWYALSELGRLRQICAPDSMEFDRFTLIQELWQIANPSLRSETSLYQRKTTEFQTYLANRVQRPKQVFGFVERLYDEVLLDLDIAFRNYSQAHKDSLSAFFFGSWSESDDRQKYDEFLGNQGLKPLQDLDLQEFASVFELCDFAALNRAYTVYQAGMDALIPHCKTLRYSPFKPIYHNSRHGLMIIGSTNSDHYNSQTDKKLRGKRIAFILEPSGNDLYEIDVNTDWAHPLYMLIDMDGDDVYRNNTPAGLFSVIGGIGASYDASGNDLYQSDDFAFCAYMGANLHIDSEGDDTYKSGLFSQAAAMFGIAVLIDEKGSDSYSATSFAQAMGGTMAVGALIDHAGDDIYYIGGKYLHKPLMSNDYRSMGQGMGFGFRPDFGGGLGLLYDYSGNDKYIGGVYAQGVGYWYAGGILIDENGNDVYNAIYYPQGSGIHLAYGILFDSEGDDNYFTRNGPGQGAGHDWSLGIMIDRAGNDIYSIPGGNGLGLSNSVGIFVDSSGDDRYERRNDSSLGYANLARGTGGIGLFLDAGGKDNYPDTLFSDNATWKRGTYGIGRDMELNILEKSKIESMAEEASAEIDSLAAIADIFAVASEWEVGSAVQRVRKARAILISRDQEASEYIISSKLGTKSGLEYRTLEELVGKSEYFKHSLYDVLADEDSLKEKNALSLISATGDTMLVDFVENLIAAGKYVPAALSSLGSIKSAKSIKILEGFMDHSSERYRYITARSLARLKTPEADAILKRYVDDPSFLVRTLIRNM